MEYKLKVFKVKIQGTPHATISKRDRRFKSGVRIEKTDPYITYTIDIVTDNPNGIIRMSETIFTVLDTFRVIAIDNFNNKVSMRCVRINKKDNVNFNIEHEMFFKSGGFAVSESSSYLKP